MVRASLVSSSAEFSVGRTPVTGSDDDDAWTTDVTILVTGATGGVGRLVVDHLLAAGATDVRALTVDPGRARLPAGVEVVRGHMGRPDALRAALDGVDRMYLAPQPATVEQAMAAVADAGVGHVVDLSGEHDSWWGSVTRAVEAAGRAWTHLWPGDFMENVGSWAEQIRTRGEVREPWPDSATAPIAMDGVAGYAVPATDVVERLTGRPATTFARWAEANARTVIG